MFGDALLLHHREAQRLGYRLGAHVVLLRGLHLAAAHVIALVVADLACGESLAHQQFRYRGSEPVDLGLVHDIGGRLVLGVGGFLGLALRLLVQ